MPFPASGIGVLDNFNRSNEGPPPSSSWTTGVNGLKVSGNQCVPNTTGDNSASWNVETFGANYDMFLTLVTHGSIGTGLIMADSSNNGYGVYCYPTGNIAIRRLAAGTPTTLGSEIAAGVANGDKIGLRKIGSLLIAYRYTGGVWYMAGWRVDTTYSGGSNTLWVLHSGSSGAVDDVGAGDYEGITYVGGKVAGSSGQGGGSVDLTTGLLGGTGGAPIEGDLVVVTVSVGSQGRQPDLSIVTPADYVPLTANRTTSTTYDTNVRTCYKVMGSTPDTSVTIPASGSSQDGIAYAIQVFRGVDPTNPMSVTPQYATDQGTDNLPNPASITPGHTGAWIVVCGGGAAGAGGTYAASGLTAFGTANGPDNNDGNVGVGFITEWESGAYDPAKFTGGSVNAANSWGCTTIALRPYVPPEDKTLSDSGSGVDALTVAQTVAKTLADSGTGADAQTIAATPALSDSGAGADVLSFQSDLSIADVGAGVDGLAVQMIEAKALTDEGTGEDVVGLSADPALVDAGSGTDVQGIDVDVILADSGSGVDTMSKEVEETIIPKSLADSGSGEDSAAISADPAAADSGAGSDAQTILANVSIRAS